MSEYTSVYLRKKDEPLLSYRSYPSHEDTQDMTQEEIIALTREVEAHNDAVCESLGCELFDLCTTPSRELEVLPWTDQPQALTKDLLDEIITFYDDEIEELKKRQAEHKEQISILEGRIVRASVKLYGKIDEDIRWQKRSIESCEEEIENYQHYRQLFAFARGIINHLHNDKCYELIYTKC